MNSVSALNISGQAFAYQRAGKNICIWKLETDFSFKFKLKPEFIYIHIFLWFFERQGNYIFNTNRPQVN